MHDAPAPRIAIYSQWTATQDLGWYRLTFDNFGIPYDLIYKEQVQKGDLRSQYDVILMAAQNINRQTVLQAPSARPQPYQKSDKYKILGMYGETPDMSGGFGQAGVDAFAKFLEGGGTLIAAGAAVRFPIEFGWAHTVDAEAITGVTAQRPVVQGELVRPEHPVFYGYTEKTIPIKYQGGVTLRVGVADQANVLARYVGGDSSVLTRLDGRRRPAAAEGVRGGHPWRVQRQGPRGALRQQPDLPLAEPRRVQHGVQLAAELELRTDDGRTIEAREPGDPPSPKFGRFDSGDSGDSIRATRFGRLD